MNTRETGPVSSTPVVKTEPLDLSLSVIESEITRLMKKTRHGNDAQTNCGYLTDYAIETLCALLNGQIPVEKIAETKNSAAVTPTHVVHRRTPVKKETGATNQSIQTVSSFPLPANTGLHAHLPPVTAPHITIETGQHSEVVDLDSEKIQRICVPHRDLKAKLINEAKLKNAILYGDIAFARPENTPVGHVIAFCASPDTAFFIDGQLFNGITQKGNPVFDELTTAKASQSDERAFYFQDEKVPATSRGNVFQSNCFYLIYGCKLLARKSNMNSHLNLNSTSTSTSTSTSQTISTSSPSSASTS